MSQDATPSMTEMHREQAEFGAPGAARSALETPPDTEFDALTDLFIGDAALSPQSLPDLETNSSVLRIVPHDKAQSLMVEMDLDEAEEICQDGQQAVTPRITALVLGHLPVFASAWANQYARHLAESAGTPVAVLRIRGGYASVDLVGSNIPEIEAADTIDEAISRASEISSQWVLRVGEPDEPALAACDAIDELTLLTGIDEAAVVASYQTLKRFAQSEQGPEVTLAVMAASEESARPIAHKISRATETFLERPARIVCCIERISGGPSTHVFGGDSTITLEDALKLVHSAAAATNSLAERFQAIPAIVPSMESKKPESICLPEHDEPGDIEHEDIKPVIDSGESAAQTPTATHSRKADCVLDAFEPLAATCPYSRAVSLAINTSGTLQLIADADALIEDQLVQLTTAAGWAADHMTLLALTDPRLDQAAQSESHLITRNAAGVRRLLDSQIHIHLVVEAGAARVFVPLNEG